MEGWTCRSVREQPYGFSSHRHLPQPAGGVGVSRRRSGGDRIGVPSTPVARQREQCGELIPGDSQAFATSGEEQVGVDNGHALLWRSSAASVVDLHAFLPPRFKNSHAAGINSGGDIVGFASGSESYSSHTFLWKRNAPKPATSSGQNTARCENP